MFFFWKQGVREEVKMYCGGLYMRFKDHDNFNKSLYILIEPAKGLNVFMKLFDISSDILRLVLSFLDYRILLCLRLCCKRTALIVNDKDFLNYILGSNDVDCSVLGTLREIVRASRIAPVDSHLFEEFIQYLALVKCKRAFFKVKGDQLIATSFGGVIKSVSMTFEIKPKLKRLEGSFSDDFLCNILQVLYGIVVWIKNAN
jgi:hypothetical protein